MNNSTETLTFNAADYTGSLITATLDFSHTDHIGVRIDRDTAYKVDTCEIGYQLQDGEQVIATVYQDETYPHIWRAFDEHSDCERDADNPVVALLQVALNIT